MIYIGIDPGANGGIGVIDATEHTAEAYVYSDETLVEILHRPGRMRVAVEQLNPMPNTQRGNIAHFKLGCAYGIILGILTALRQQHELVNPRKWKKEFSVTADKNTSISVCKALFPDVNLKRTDKCTKDHDGMAEALLIAEYARRHMK